MFRFIRVEEYSGGDVYPATINAAYIIQIEPYEIKFNNGKIHVGTRLWIDQRGAMTVLESKTEIENLLS